MGFYETVVSGKMGFAGFVTEHGEYHYFLNNTIYLIGLQSVLKVLLFATIL
jgi:hypothetical protein